MLLQGLSFQKTICVQLCFSLGKPIFAWHTLFIDVVGPLHKCSSGYMYLIVVIDKLTKWVEAKPICNLSTITAVKLILDLISWCHRCPNKKRQTTAPTSHLVYSKTQWAYGNLMCIFNSLPSRNQWDCKTCLLFLQ